MRGVLKASLSGIAGEHKMTHRNDRGFRASRPNWQRWFLGLGAVLLLLPALAVAQPVCESASKSFSPAIINSGNQSKLSITLTEACATTFDQIFFTDDLTAAGMQLVPGFAASQCGGTVAATANGFSFSNGLVGPKSSCTVSVNVTASSPVNVTLNNVTSPIDWCGDCSIPAVSGRLSVVGGTPPRITSGPPPSGTFNTPYSFQITVAGTAPITLTASGLPPGLSLNAANQITGTPTQVGSFPGQILATNGFKPDGTQNFTLVISAPQLLITTGSPLPSGNAGSSYSVTFNATGGIPGYSWSQGGGTLPPGLTLNNAGTLAGTPTKPGSFTFDIVVTDSTKTTAKKTFTLVVGGIPPTITSGPPPAGVVGVPYSHTITVTGTQPIGVTVSGLPPGLSFNPGTNQITGTPTAAGSYPGSILAFNGVPPDATQAYTIVVTSPPLNIPTIPQLPPPAVGQPYPPVTIPVMGGTPPYTFTVCKGQLPPGMDLSKSSGVLSGTPTQAGSFTFDICVTDSAGNSTSTTLTLIVAAVSGNITVIIAPNPDTAGIPVVVDIQVGGGNTIATGQVHVAAAGTGMRCPPPFSVGAPSDPLAPDHPATLDAKGHATITLNKLKIDDYLVCVNYSGDTSYAPGSAGPFPLSVIKGLLLGPPKVLLIVPDRVPTGSTIAAHVEVTPSGTTRVPQGVVMLRNGDTDIAGTVLVNGVATVPIVASGAGALMLTADYLGDGVFPGASSDTVQVRVDAVADVVGAAPGPVDVPTLTPLALVALMLALAAAGWWTLRRRRA